MFWTFFSSFVLLTGLAYAALRLWGSVALTLEQRERCVYGDSLTSLAPMRQEKLATTNLTNQNQLYG